MKILLNDKFKTFFFRPFQDYLFGVIKIFYNSESFEFR